MIPRLYLSTTAEFDSNGEGLLRDTLECYVEEERNGLFDLSMKIPVDSFLFDKIEKGNIIKAHASDRLKNQLFRINIITKPIDGIVLVYAKHIFFDLDKDFIESLSINNQSCEYVLNQIFKNSRKSKHFIGTSDIVNSQSYAIEKYSPLECIAGKEGSIIDTFGTGAEILRDNFTVSVNNTIGKTNNVLIAYGKNLDGFELKEDVENIICEIYPYVKYKDSDNNEVEFTLQEKYVQSPRIGNYDFPTKTISKDFSDKFEDNEVPTESKLREVTLNYFTESKCDIPKCSYSIKFIPLSKTENYKEYKFLEDVGMCDKVHIWNSKYNIKDEAKVIKTKYNVLTERYESVELGEPKTTLGNLIGSGESTVGPQGPQGIPGQDGADGDIGDFPDSLPSVPVITLKSGLGVIAIDWTFENKVYYTYEVYASQKKDFIPNAFDLIFKGQASSFSHYSEPNQTWYYKVRAINSHGNATEFSSQKSATTGVIDADTEWIGKAAIGNAQIGTLSLDRGWVDQLKGQWIDARTLTVTDGNGKRTFEVDSFGRVNLDVTELKISSKDVATTEKVTNAIDEYDGTVDSKINSAKTEIKVDTDKINLEVLKTKEENTINLIKNSNFTASPKMQLWSFWQSADGGRWYEHQHGGFPLGEGIGLQCASGQNCTATSTDVAVVHGEQYTISMDLLVERNVDHAIVMIREIDNNGSFVNTHEYRYPTNFEGRISNTFTVDNANTKYVQVLIWHKGAIVDNGQYVVVFFNRVQLQRGAVATPWRNAIDNQTSKTLATLQVESSGVKTEVQTIKNDYAKGSELRQTDEKFEYKFNKTCNNVVLNSTGKSKNINPWVKFEYTNAHNCVIQSRNDYWTNYDDAIEVMFNGNSGNIDGGAIQGNVKVKAGRVYTLSCQVAGHRSTKFVGVTNQANNKYLCHAPIGEMSGANQQWAYIVMKFTPEEDIINVRLGISEGRPDSGAPSVHGWFKNLCIVEGDFPNLEWRPNNSEVMNDITNIDSNGIIVKHESGSYSRMNSTEFFQANESGDRTLAIRYGGFRQYAFPRNGNDARHYLGSLSSTTIGDLYGTTMFGTSGNGYLSFGFSEMIEDTLHSGINSWMFLNHYDGNGGVPQGIHTYRRLYVRNGATFSNRPEMLYGIGFPYDGNPDNINSEISYISTSANASPGTRTLWLSGADSIYLNVQNGGDYSGHRILEDGSSGAKLRHECWGNWDMKGWRMYNVDLNYSLQDKSLPPEVRNYSYNRQATQVMSTKQIIQDRGEDETVDIGEELCVCVVEIPADIRYNIGKYDVNIIKYGRGDIWVSERAESYFLVESEKPITFTWVLEGEKLETSPARNYDFTAFTEPTVEAGEVKESAIVIPHSKYATMNDEQIEEELLKEQIELLKENNELYKLYTKD